MKRWGDARLLAAVLVVIPCWGCIRPPELLEPDFDVLGVATVVVAGGSDAIVLLSHPHRTSGPPDIELRLIGPGWDATFSENLHLEDDCGIQNPAIWPGSVACLRAGLPEPIRERTGYMIAAAGPAGPISGSLVVPIAPAILEPMDGQRFAPQSNGRDQSVRVRFETAPDVSMLQAEVIEAVEIASDGSEVPIEGRLVLEPFRLDLEAGVDEIRIRRAHAASLYLRRPVRISLRLLGFERNYANFVEVAGTYPARQPYPSFGLEGAFGYFGAVAPSEPVRIIIEPPE